MLKRVQQANFNLSNKTQQWFKDILKYKYGFFEKFAKPEEIMAFLDFQFIMKEIDQFRAIHINGEMVTNEYLKEKLFTKLDEF